MPFSKAKLLFNLELVPNQLKRAAFTKIGTRHLVKGADVREKPEEARVGVAASVVIESPGGLDISEMGC